MKFLLAIALVLLAFIFVGCSEQEGINSPSTTEYEMMLKKDTNINELFSIRDDLTKRVLESGVSGKEIADIVEHNDSRRFAEITGYTAEELDDIGRRINLFGKVIQERYPDLQERVGKRPEGCIECDFKNIAEKWDNALVTHKQADVFYRDGDENQIPLPDPSKKGVTCQWLQYGGSLAVCTALGPVLYWACAAVAVCAFCTGVWVSTMCQT